MGSLRKDEFGKMYIVSPLSLPISLEEMGASLLRFGTLYFMREEATPRQARELQSNFCDDRG
jgi:hypothetical protein